MNSKEFSVVEKFEKFSDPNRAIRKPQEVEKKSPFKVSLSPIVVSKLLMLAIATAVIVTVGHLIYQALIVAEKTDQLRLLTQQRAELTAKSISVYLSEIETLLSRYSDRPSVVNAMRLNDQAALTKQAEVIKKELDGVIAVRFIPKGKVQLDETIYPPIRFSEVDLIKKAEQGQATLPEAALISKTWLITSVVPVKAADTNTIFGTLVLTLVGESLQSVMLQNNAGMGEIKLIQRLPNVPPRTFVVAGGGAIGDVAVAPTSHPQWVVEFTPSLRLSDQTHINVLLIIIPFFICATVLLVLSLVGGGWLGRRYVKVQRNSVSATLQAMVNGQSDKDGVRLTNPMFQKTDMLDLEIEKKDEALLGLESGDSDKVRSDDRSEHKSAPAAVHNIPESIFRAYDIRGLAGTEVSNSLAQQVGQALGSEAMDVGEDTLIVARDARNSSPELAEYLIRGILSTGCNVLNIGTVPTPLMYFATETLSQTSSGVMVTASHNPGADNGFKMVMQGRSASEQGVKAVRARILSNNIYQGSGEEHRYDIIPDYIDTIFSDVALAGDISIVVDAGNAVPGIVAPRLFEELGCQVTPLFCELDGNFPNHSPDPTIEANLQALIAKVKEVKADLGVALDGDGDRLVVVTPQGKIIWPDRLLMLFARDIVSRNPGSDVVFDVKCTRHLIDCITEVGGRPIMWKTGHGPMKNKMIETGALVGGEYSGHIFIKDRWYGFDDGLYAAARLIEMLSLHGEDLDALFAEFPESPSTPEIRIDVPEDKKFGFIAKLLDEGDFGDGKITTLDGLRADFSFGWGLVRASNTSAHLTMRFEADTDENLHKLKALFVRELRKIDSSIHVNWT
ncbi:phosphomannomutase/phosphoglucomutase [Teredinibacter waterburyi]|jgi:phosphomannomutase (EC 5.4.2.8)|uniref:phosphomannomutase/phosphoglucomutase n=1 Tax=Teredinibacter waterburyi TaxID=1500538 RepID=UPI001CAA87D8|nr:phosphomannomutase/phosphoglucomutase [Teredinibacter waterburyi]